jgi:UDP-N-acetylmuramoyl-tripeptide--D-alanyl-D-alanine ligase
MQLLEILKVLGAGSQAIGDTTGDPVGFSIDSRTLRPGELFFAIKGPIHDGHGFVAEVLSRGAVGAVMNRGFHGSGRIRDNQPGLVIEVDDTLIALQRLASSVLRAWRGKEVAITGSMGKTTTKELTAAALSAAGRTVKTVGNLNNEFGLPLSVLRMESDGSRATDFDFAVLEMGMNHKGEIARLCEIAPPDVSVVTVVAPVHLEFFSSVDEIAEAKAEIVKGTKTGGACVLNADDDRVAQMRRLRADVEFRTFGIDRDADVVGRQIRSDGMTATRFLLTTRKGEAPCSLPLAGRHNVYNALAAAAVADYFEISPNDIAAALSTAVSPKMRGDVLRFAEGFTVIDDSYNSNPRALIEMVRTITDVGEASRRVVVAGEMLELGERGPELHREAGRKIKMLGIDLLIGVRGLASEIVAGAVEAGMAQDAAVFCQSPEEAGSLVEKAVRRGDLVLVKGSRGVKTEIVVQRLKQAFEQLGERGEPASP